MKKTIFLFSLIFSVILFSQDLKLNKKIKSDSDYLHSISGISAPISLKKFLRQELKQNSKNDSIFSAEYIDEKSESTYKFSIFPALLDEERLMNFYFKSLIDKKFTPKEINLKSTYFKKGSFRMNGISGIYKNLDNWVNYRVYDSGFWIFVSEISQKNNDTIFLQKKQDELIELINPTKIIEKNPITRYSNIHYAKACFRDSLMLRSAMSSATNKMKWIYENINKYERASGIPAIYLEYQEAGINGFIDYTTEKNPKPSKGTYETERMIDSLSKLRHAGFLDEFLMEQYKYLLISKDENHKFDFESYKNWKKENFVDFDVYKKYYLIVNSRKKADLSKEE